MDKDHIKYLKYKKKYLKMKGGMWRPIIRWDQHYRTIIQIQDNRWQSFWLPFNNHDNLVYYDGNWMTFEELRDIYGFFPVMVHDDYHQGVRFGQNAPTDTSQSAPPLPRVEGPPLRSPLPVHDDSRSAPPLPRVEDAPPWSQVDPIFIISFLENEIRLEADKKTDINTDKIIKNIRKILENKSDYDFSNLLPILFKVIPQINKKKQIELMTQINLVELMTQINLDDQHIWEKFYNFIKTIKDKRLYGEIIFKLYKSLLEKIRNSTDEEETIQLIIKANEFLKEFPPNSPNDRVNEIINTVLEKLQSDNILKKLIEFSIENSIRSNQLETVLETTLASTIYIRERERENIWNWGLKYCKKFNFLLRVFENYESLGMRITQSFTKDFTKSIKELKELIESSEQSSRIPIHEDLPTIGKSISISADECTLFRKYSGELETYLNTILNEHDINVVIKDKLDENNQFIIEFKNRLLSETQLIEEIMHFSCHKERSKTFATSNHITFLDDSGERIYLPVLKSEDIRNPWLINPRRDSNYKIITYSENDIRLRCIRAMVSALNYIQKLENIFLSGNPEEKKRREIKAIQVEYKPKIEERRMNLLYGELSTDRSGQR